MKAISPEKYNTFCKSFGQTPGDEHLRFGQKFCNTFDIHDPELFYCKITNHAKVLIMKYLE